MDTDNSIVLLTVDCLRADHVGSYGYHRETTPHIDSLADRSLLFEHGYSNGMGTRFAFKAINGGTYPLRIEGAGLPANDGCTIAERLSEQGYTTIGFANNPFITRYFNHGRGFDTFYDVNHWGEEKNASEEALDRINTLATKISSRLSDGVAYRTLKRLYDTAIKTTESVAGDVGYTDAEMVDEAIEWVDNRTSSDDPFFLWVHFMDVHHPYRYDQTHRKSLGIETDFVRNPLEEIEHGSDAQRAAIDTYDSMIRRVDEQIGRLVSSLPESVSLVLTGDHGEEFGLHDTFHTALPYNTMAWVPLIISTERVNQARVETAVSHVDIAPTICELAGVDDIPTVWDGVSIRDFESLPEDRTVYVGLETPDYIRGAAVRPPWKYVHEERAEGESRGRIVNFEDDPEEQIDYTDEAEAVRDDLEAAWNDHFEDVMSDRIAAEHPMWNANRSLSGLRTELEDGDIRNQQATEEEDLETIEERLEHLGYK